MPLVFFNSQLKQLLRLALDGPPFSLAFRTATLSSPLRHLPHHLSRRVQPPSLAALDPPAGTYRRHSCRNRLVPPRRRTTLDPLVGTFRRRRVNTSPRRSHVNSHSDSARHAGVHRTLSLSALATSRTDNPLGNVNSNLWVLRALLIL
jgi:hypothetical protein